MAEAKILIQGFTGDSGEGETCSTITLVRDQNLIMVVDPGVLASQRLLIEVLKQEGLTVDDVTHVFITHSHLDHYRNIGMFATAKTVEHFGIWDKGYCDDRPEQFTKNIKIIETPGHSYDALSLLVETDLGTIAVVGDVFWRENYPDNDPYASDPEQLSASRKKILELADYIIPGHGPMYKVKK
jgi:glyoxylase-like metal-dependent hydrolase (beta-lactamase superfamily II)